MTLFHMGQRRKKFVTATIANGLQLTIGFFLDVDELQVAVTH